MVLSACQIAAPQQTGPAPLLPDQPSVSVAGVTVGSSSARTPTSATYTIKRDTLRDSLGLSGKVVPGRSAQLTFRGSGIVSSVSVVSGQAVTQGQVLADFTLDDDSLQAARAQSTLADLSYQTELDKLRQLQSPASRESVQQLRITIEKDQAEIQKLEEAQAAVLATADRNEKALAVAQATAERKVAIGELGLKSAKDAQTAAQASLKRVQEDVQSAQQQSSADASAAVATATGAVRSATRQLEEANARLEEAKSEPAAATVAQQLETQQLRVDQDREAVSDAQAAATTASKQSPSTDHPARQIAAEVDAANAAAKAAERVLAADLLELKHLQVGVQSAKRKDASEVRAATYAVEAAKDQLANARLAEPQAQQKAQAVANQTTSGSVSRGGAQTIEAAAGGVAQADTNVRLAEINLEEARAALQSVGEAPTAAPQSADHGLAAARIQLSLDQARLAALQDGNAGIDVERQQIRVNLLRDQAITAATAAQPVVQLKAPFDATVAEVVVSTGQTLVNGTSTVDGAAGDSRIPAIRLVATSAASVMADASESEIAQLNSGQSIDLSFPGVPDLAVPGRIVEVGGIATVKNNRPTYPVRIEMSAVPPMVKLGMTAQASVPVAEAKDVLVAPRRAVRTFSGGTLVDKLDADGQVQTVPVQLGRTFGANVELLGGVQEGDVVAVYEGVNAPSGNSNGRQP
jgi:multidrug efflux pump subunit AcrA (membrane-fusion protein)